VMTERGRIARADAFWARRVPAMWRGLHVKHRNVSGGSAPTKTPGRCSRVPASRPVRLVLARMPAGTAFTGSKSHGLASGQLA